MHNREPPGGGLGIVTPRIPTNRHIDEALNNSMCVRQIAKLAMEEDLEDDWDELKRITMTTLGKKPLGKAAYLAPPGRTTPRPGSSSGASTSSYYGRLQALRNTPTHPTSAAATNLNLETCPKIHESFQGLKTYRRRHCEALWDGGGPEGQLEKPEVRPDLTSQEVGWNAVGLYGKTPQFPHRKSQMTCFRQEMMRIGHSEVLDIDRRHI